MGKRLGHRALLQRALSPAKVSNVMTTIVWFKRDLRVFDHGPLLEAASLGEPVIPLYVMEQDYWQQPDTSERHWQFIAESLRDQAWTNLMLQRPLLSARRQCKRLSIVGLISRPALCGLPVQYFQPADSRAGM